MNKILQAIAEKYAPQDIKKKLDAARDAREYERQMRREREELEYQILEKLAKLPLPNAETLPVAVVG